MSNYAIIDKRTGEIIEENLILIGKKPKYIDKGFIKIFVAFLSDIIENQKIAGKAIRLLFYMLEQLDYNSYTIKIIPKHAQKKLKITKDTYYRWINDLIKEGIITKIDTYTYKLNPYVAVRGNMKKALDNEIEEIQKKIRYKKS